MINEYRSAYKFYADNVEGWKDLSESELCSMYLKYQDTDKYLANVYMSALLYKVLPRALALYNKQSYPILSEEDCYDIVVNSVLYVLDKKVWVNESSSLYNTENAPEIAINTRIKSQFLNELKAKHTLKRKSSAESVSLDSLEDMWTDGYFTTYVEPTFESGSYIKLLVNKFFHKGEPLKAFILDCILNEDVFTEEGHKFCMYTLVEKLKNLDSNYCEMFSEEYGVDEKDVEKSSLEIKELTSGSIYYSIYKLFRELLITKDFYLAIKNVY